MMNDDLINRQAAIDAICKACSMEEDYHKCDGYPEGSTWCDELVALRALPSAQPEKRTNNRTETHSCDLPSAKPERPTGRWETAFLDHEAFGVRPKVLYCSKCQQCIAYPTRFCPNCGSPMEVEHD